MNEDYRKEIVEIERGIVETYLKVIIQYYPNLDKPKIDVLINGLERLVKDIAKKDESGKK